jgi:phage tail P2-like protein
VTSILPSNATPLETALDESIDRISSVPVPVRDVWNVWACPTPLLPWLAWAFSADFWDPTWTEAQKRNAISTSIIVQRYKGTIGAVTNALDALGYDVTIQEWWQMSPPGDPYTFNVLIDSDQVGIDLAGFEKIISYINIEKNLRSHMGSIQPSVTTPVNPVVAGGLTIGNDILISAGESGFLVLDGSWALDGSQTLNGIAA